MSNRTLIEINHDCAHDIERGKDTFMYLLGLWLRCGDREAREALADDWGVRIISQRHHSDKFFIDEREDGFPAKYIDRAAQEKAP